MAAEMDVHPHIPPPHPALHTHTLTLTHFWWRAPSREKKKKKWLGSSIILPALLFKLGQHQYQQPPSDPTTASSFTVFQLKKINKQTKKQTGRDQIYTYICVVVFKGRRRTFAEREIRRCAKLFQKGEKEKKEKNQNNTKWEENPCL